MSNMYGFCFTLAFFVAAAIAGDNAAPSDYKRLLPVYHKDYQFA